MAAPPITDPTQQYRSVLSSLVTARDGARVILASLADATSVPNCRCVGETHVAARYELAMAIQGKPYLLLPNGAVALPPEALLLVEKGLVHGEGAATRSKGHVAFWCHVFRNRARVGYTRLSPESGWEEGESLLLAGRTNLESIVGAIESELIRKGWGWQGCVEGLLRYLLTILIRRLDRGESRAPGWEEPPTVRADSRTWDVIGKVFAYCDANPRRHPRLQEVAAALGYDRSHLGRVLTSHLGRPFAVYMRGRRIEKARQLLEDSDLSVGGIAESLGYRDPAHFSRAFQRVVGLYPTVYRDRLRGL